MQETPKAKIHGGKSKTYSKTRKKASRAEQSETVEKIVGG